MTQLAHDLPMPESVQIWNDIGNIAEGRLQSPAAIVRIPAKPPHPFHLQGKIKLPGLLEDRTLGLGKNSQNEIATGLQIQHFLAERNQCSTQPYHRRGFSDQMQVRGSLRDAGSQEINEIEGCHSANFTGEFPCKVPSF